MAATIKKMGRSALFLAVLALWVCSQACSNGDKRSPLGAVAQRAAGDPVTGTLQIKDNWGSGYRAEVTLCNAGTLATITWRVVVALNQATYAGAYNATGTVSGGQVTFAPSGNAVIQPGQCVTFGYTGVRTGSNYLPTLVGVCSKNASVDYCAGGGGTGGTGGATTGGTGGATGGTGGVVTGGTGGATGGTGGASSGGTGGAGDPVTGTLQIKDNWGSGYRAEVTLCNAGTLATITWRVVVALNQATYAGAYNATGTVSGGQVTFVPLGNAVIQPGQCVTFGYTGVRTGSDYLPTLVGVCSKNASVDYCAGGGGTGGTGGTTGGTGGATGGTGGSSGGTGGVATGGTGGTTGGSGGSSGGTGGSSGGTGGTTGGTGGATGGASQTLDVTCVLPSWVDARRVAIGVASDLYMSDGSKVVSQSRTWQPMVTNTGAQRTEVGQSASSGTVIGFASVFLRNDARVYGDAISKGPITKQLGAWVAGDTLEYQEIPAGLAETATYGWRARVPAASTEPVMLEPGETRPLLGGSYGDVYVKPGSTLDLSAARLFRFHKLMVDTGGIVQVADGAPSQIYVDTDATWRGALTTPTASTPPAMTMAILGTGQMPFETEFRGLIVAPQGQVVLGGIDRDFYGAVCASAAELRTDVILHHLDFYLPPFGGNPPEGGGVDVPVSSPFASASAHCGPRDKLASSAWPMQGFCPAQLSLSPFNGTRTNELYWIAGFMASPVGQPVVGANENVHVATADGRLTTLSSEGHLRWAVKLPGIGVPSAAPTVLRNGDVVVPFDNGFVRAVDRNGQVLWSASACSATVTAVTVEQNANLLVACSDGTVSRISPQGVLGWSVTLSSGIDHVPTVGNPDVLLVAAQDALVRLSLEDGAEIWSQPLTGAPSGPAALVRDTAFVATEDGKALAIALDGTVSWQTDLLSAPAGAPAISPWGLVLVPMQTGELVAISARSGWEAGRASVGSSALNQVIVASDGLAYVSSADQVACVVPTSGRILWTYALGGAPLGMGLSSQGRVLVGNAAQQVLAIGGSSHWTLGQTDDAVTRSSMTPAQCQAQMLATGLDHCDAETANTGDTYDRLAPTTDDDTTSDDVGQSACVNAGPPSGLTSQGLEGLGYISSQDPASGQLVGEMVYDPPSDVPEECRLRFCEEVYDTETGKWVEQPISMSIEDLQQEPASGSECEAVDIAVTSCPIDPDSAGAECEDDSSCADGQFCAVFCDDAACQVPTLRCGTRMDCVSTGALSAEPTGPYDEDDPSTWPCADVLECAETGDVFGVSGDPDLRKTGSLEQRNLPPMSMTERPLAVMSASYPSYVDTLAADPCNPAAIGGTQQNEIDSRSGSSGNSKWGLFVEPDVSQDYDLEVSDILGLPNIYLRSTGSFRAGARVWGKEIEIINARAEALLSTCNGRLLRDLKVLGEQVEQWAVYGSDDQASAPPPPSEEDVAACENARVALDRKFANLRKSLYDARVAWDAYRRNGNVAPTELCERTAAVLGNVDPGCTVQSARVWLQRYQSVVAETEAFIDNEYRAALQTIADQTEGGMEFAGATGGPYANIGATTHYPIGPLTLTVEIEVVGDLSAGGKLSYSMSPKEANNGDGGPSVRIEVAPGAYVDAYAFVGVGIPGVSVGVEGQLKLIGVTAPIYAGVTLSRQGFADQRPADSSGLFASVSGGPSLLRQGNVQKWNTKWTYGAGVRLETLSGRINLAARVRLLFFKKTFRKKMADWDGLTKTYEFVGSLNQPLSGVAQTDVILSDVPYPDGEGDLEVAFNATPVTPDEFGVSTLGGIEFPGACHCIDYWDTSETCTMDYECCNNGICLEGVCNPPAL